MEKIKNIYEKTEVGNAEKKRLKELEYPTSVSEELIGDNLEGKTLLDLGAGPNVDLNRFTKEHGGAYLAFDINAAFLEEQKKEGVAPIRGSIEHLPFKENSVDVTHTRFVLMHLFPPQREAAIQEALRVTKEKALFLEYDWGATTGGELIDAFKQFAVAFMQLRGMEPFMGAKLEDTVREAIQNKFQIEEKRFHREPGNYYDEIIPLARSMKEILATMKEEKLLATLGDLLTRLENESRKESPEIFIRPDIVAVEVKK
ncbi:MAG: class I SAM-dependent methyltransferase [Minisyncoccota bacterium]